MDRERIISALRHGNGREDDALRHRRLVDSWHSATPLSFVIVSLSRHMFATDHSPKNEFHRE